MEKQTSTDVQRVKVKLRGYYLTREGNYGTEHEAAIFLSRSDAAAALARSPVAWSDSVPEYVDVAREE